MKTPESITIRPASARDAVVVHAMIVELAASMQNEAKVSATRQDIASALSGNDPAIHALLAERDREPVGVALFFLTYSTWRGTRGVYLQDIYVTESERGSGLGRQLLGHVASWANERDANHLRLSVDRKNAAAQSFYKQLGLSLSEEEMVYDVVGGAFDDLSTAE